MLTPMAVQDINDVELVATGTWNAGTGRATITRADLEDALAAHADNLVDRAPVKLGHTSKLNEGVDEGHPAYGWVTPERIIDRPDGSSVLVGSLKGVPAKLADTMNHAYRRRSVELAQQVKTSGGKTYRAVLTGLALLGVTPPAVKSLADVLAYYSDGDDITDARTVTLSLEDTDTPSVPHDTPTPADDGEDTEAEASPEPQEETSMPDLATMTEDDVRKALNLQADQDLVAELSRLIDHLKVDQKHTPAQPAAPAPAAQMSEQVHEADQGDGAMTKTGIEQTASQAAAEGEAPVDNPAQAAQEQPATVTLSAGQFAEFQSLVQERQDRRVSELIDGAFQAGKITTAERGTWLSAAQRDYDGTKTIIDGLATRFSTSEAGYDNAANTGVSPDLDAALDAWTESGTIS